jgi:alpha-L-fucosidase
MKYYILIGLLLHCLAASARYQPNWDSLNSRSNPEWYDDAKFGIFIHWGVYSVPAWAPVGTYEEWYWMWLEQDIAAGNGSVLEFHRKNYGENFEYPDFAPMFRAELFDPNYWAYVLAKSGAKYIVPTSKHHEGFTLWKSPQSWNWNAVDNGPHRDLLKDLLDAVEAHGLHRALYFSLYEWFNPLYRGPHPHEYVEQIMLPQLYDVVTNYKPDYIFADGEWEHSSEFWNSTDFLAWLYNDSPVKDSVVVNDRWGNDCKGKNGGAFTAEYDGEVWWDHKWEENSGMDVFSFGLNRASQLANYSTPRQALHLLVRTVSNGGNYLLDFGPTADGRMPLLIQDRLLNIGEWLSVNGDAIYRTRPWSVRNEPANNHTWIYYTRSKQSSSVVYATFLSWKTNNLLLTVPESSSSTVVTLLGHNQPLNYRFNASEGLHITLPQLPPDEIPSRHMWSLKLTGVKELPSLIPVQNYFSQNFSDNALCSNSSCVEFVTSRPDGYYSVENFEGILLKDNIDGTVPLSLFYSKLRKDFASVTNKSVFNGDTSYQFLGTQGFVFKQRSRPGLIALDLYYNAQLTDFFLLGTPESKQQAMQSGYKFIGTQGYAFGGPYYDNIFL